MNNSQTHIMSPMMRVAKNTAVVFLSRLIDTGSGILLTMILARYLKPAIFGEYAFITAIVMALQHLINLELNTILIRDLSRSLQYQQVLFGSALFLKAIMTGVFLLIMIGIDGVIQLDTPLRIAYYLAAAAEIFQQIYCIISPVFLANERMEYDTFTTMVYRIITLVGTIAAVFIFSDAMSVMSGFIAVFGVLCFAQIVRCFFAIWLLRSVFNIKRLEIKMAESWRLIRQVWIMGIAAFCTGLSLRVDVYFLKAFHGPEEVSFFQLPNSVILQVQLIAIALVTALFPMMSRLGGEGYNRSDSEKMIGISIKFMAAAGTWISIFLIFFAKPILLLLGGPLFLVGSNALMVLSITVPTLFIQLWGCNYLTSRGRQNQLIYGATLSLLINAFLDFLWVPSHGALGAAFATLIAYTAQCAIILFLINRLIPLRNKIMTILLFCGVIMGFSVAIEVWVRELSPLKYLIIFAYILLSGIFLYQYQDPLVHQTIRQVLNRLSRGKYRK